jgi:hypothetical protein
MSMKRWLGRGLAGVAAVALLAAGGQARAGMALTAAGIAEGFTLSTFVDQIPNNGAVGPVGISFTNSGGVIVSSYAVGKNVVFANDVDNQHYSGGVLSATNFGASNPCGITVSGGVLYQALQQSDQVVQLDQAGNLVSVVTGAVGAATGITTNPNNGHLLVSDLSNTIKDVNPGNGNTTNFAVSPNGAGVDGVTANGTDLYAEAGGHIYGFHLSNGQNFFDSGFINGADGAVLGAGTLAGRLYVNTNDGRLVEVNISTNAQTVIATGGSRGDLVSVDPNNDTLLLTQTDSVLRLTPPAGGGFNTPEPASLILAGTGFLGLLGYRRLRRKQQAS